MLAARLGSRAARLALGEPPPGVCWPELTVEDGPGLTERVLAAPDPEPVVRAALVAVVLGERALAPFSTVNSDILEGDELERRAGLDIRLDPGQPDLIAAWFTAAVAHADGHGDPTRREVDPRDVDGVARELVGARWRRCEPVTERWASLFLCQPELSRIRSAVSLWTPRDTVAPRVVVLQLPEGASVRARVSPPANRAEAWQRRGFDARAERCATRELAVASNDEARGIAFGVRARARSALGDAEGAAEDWRQAVRLRPAAVAPRWGEGLLRWSQGDLAGAAEVLGEAAALVHDRLAPQARLDRARVLLAVGNHAEAVAEAERILTDPAGRRDRSPTSIWADAKRAALVLRSSARRLAGRADLALADAEAAVSSRPTDVWTLLERGRVHEALGDVPRMRADAEAALRLAPELSAALALRGQARALANDLPGALEDLRAAVARRPDEPTHREELGRLLLAMGRPDEGQRELGEARRLAPWRFGGG